MTSSTVRPRAVRTPPAAAAQSAAGGLTHRQIMTILVGLLLGMFLAALDQMIVGTAMPRIANDLHGLNIQAWVTTAYLITATISTPLYGKLSDLYGRKPFYLISISVFVVGSLLCTISTSMYELAAFRAFQGIGAGGLMSLAFTILGDIVPPRDRARYQGYFMAVFGAASVLGPVVGGALAGANDILSISGWRWVFLVNVPIGVVALVVVGRVLNVPHTRRTEHRIDWWGALALIVCLVPLLIVAEQGQTWGWGDVKSVVCYVVAALGLGAFVLAERLIGNDALIPLRLFRDRVFSLVIAAGVVVGIAMFGGFTLIPQYLQIVKGASPTASGLQMLPMMVGVMGASMVSGVITSRTGRYKIFPILGSAVTAVGALLFTRIGADTPMWQPMLYMFVFGAGVGLCMQTLTLAAQNAAPPRDMGVSTSAATFFRQIGGTLGVAVFFSILFSTVGTKIATAVRSAFGTASFQSALHDPSVLHSPANQSVLQMLTGGGSTSGALHDASFLQHIDARLAEPFKVGFSQSIGLVFWVAAGVAVVAVLISLFIKEIPLRTQSGVQAMAMEGAEGLAAPTAPAAPVAPAAAGAVAAQVVNADADTVVFAPVEPVPVAVGRPGAVAEAGWAEPVGGTPVTGVVRRTDQTPLDGAVLTLINHTGQQVGRSLSGPDGAFRLATPVDGPYVLIASAIGHQPQAATLRTAGEPVHLDLVLHGTARAVGTVCEGTGQPVAEATVTLTDARGEVVATAATDEQGRYALDELVGGGYTLVASAPGRRPAAVPLTVPDAGEVVTAVVLTGAARLAGVARGNAGRGVADARVTLVDDAGAVTAMTSTDESGNYVFSDVPAGVYTLIVSGYPPVSGHQQVRAGQETVYDVVLSHSDR